MIPFTPSSVFADGPVTLGRLRALARFNPRVVASPAPAPGYWSPLEIALEGVLAPERRRLGAAADREGVEMLRDGSALFGTAMAMRAAALRLRSARATRPLADVLLASFAGCSTPSSDSSSGPRYVLRTDRTSKSGRLT